MPSSYHEKKSAVLTVDGTSDGYITVADTTGFIVGRTGWMWSTALEREVIVVSVDSGTGAIGLRLTSVKSGVGRSDMSQFLVADDATFFQEAGVARDEV